MTQSISMKVDIWLIMQSGLYLVHLLYRLLVAEWEWKCKVGNLVFWVGKVVLELEQKHLHFGFLVLLEPKRRLLDDPTPLLLCSRKDSENRF